MAKAVVIHEFGGPEVLKVEDVEVGAPGPGEVRIKQTAAAIHFADILMREGTYFLKPELPAAIGLDGAGIVEALGDGVDNAEIGDRVAYLFSVGSYASERLLDASRLVKLPEGVSQKQAAAGLLRGLTAQYLLRQSYVVKPGDRVLVHAAAGGVGSLLCQWAKHLGATVIGTVGSEAKLAVAWANGCDHVIDYGAQDFAEAVAQITGGVGVNVVYDSIGQATYAGNIAALAPKGFFINYGHASGLLPPIDAMELNKKSIFFGKTSLKDYTADKNAADAMAKEVFGHIADGVLKIEITREYGLDEAAQAHKDLAGRKTIGSVILVP